jgi:signal transduction histidine kinase
MELTLTSRVRLLTQRYWVEILWCLFVVANTWAVLTFHDWSTVPFHFVWISISLLYGWRVWGLRMTLGLLAVAVIAPGVALLLNVLTNADRVDELTEVPLMTVVFLVMVMYVRRHVAARDEIRRVSEHNLALLQQERQFIQDASHVLRTPLTIALGHAELMLQTATDPVVAQDARVIVDELNRLKTVSNRLLALAATEQPDFAHPVPTPVRDLMTEACSRWSSTCPVRLGSLVDGYALVDQARIHEALDELIGNVVEHTPPGTPVTLSARREDGCIVLAVTDSGPGIPAPEQERIFDRFSRADGAARDNGFGLGLAIVKAIAEAHDATVAVRSEPGRGTTFELRFPSPANAADRAGRADRSGTGDDDLDEAMDQPPVDTAKVAAPLAAGGVRPR